MTKPNTIARIRLVLRILLGAVYFLAGLAHLFRPTGFISITPACVPNPSRVIMLTGMAEIAGASALVLVPPLRRAAALGLAAYAICVFPANINHAVNDIAVGGQDLGWWYHGPRLAFQPVFVWWGLWAGEVIDWPSSKVHRVVRPIRSD